MAHKPTAACLVKSLGGQPLDGLAVDRLHHDVELARKDRARVLLVLLQIGLPSEKKASLSGIIVLFSKLVAGIKAKFHSLAARIVSIVLAVLIASVGLVLWYHLLRTEPEQQFKDPLAA